MTTAPPKKQSEQLLAMLAALENERVEEVEATLQTLHPADIVDVLQAIPPEQRHELWRKVDPALMGAMIVNLVFAALAGVMIPVGVRRLGIDPALASGVALTTVTDVIGFLSFLGLATLFLI